MMVEDNKANLPVNMKAVEAKKTQPYVGPKAQDNALNRTSLIDFASDVKAELKKVSWTSPEELRVYTKVVVATTFVLGMGIYFVDLAIQSFLNGLSILIRWMG